MYPSSAPRLICSLVLAVTAGVMSPLAMASADAAAAPPCEVSWDGGGGTNRFGDAANWSGDRVPGIDDDVCIDAAHAPGVIDFSTPTSQTVNSLRTATDLVVSAGANTQLRLVAGGSLGSVRVTSGTLTTGGALTAQQVTQSGGTVGGAGAIDVAGSYTWTGGTADGTGTTTVAGGLRLGTGNLSMDQRRVRTTTGTASIAKATLLHLTRGAALALGGATSVEAATDGTGVNVVGDGALEITGNVHFAASSSLSSDASTTTSAGSKLDLSVGDSDVDISGPATIAGAVTVGPRSTLVADGEAALNLASTAQVTGAGGLEVTEGQVTIDPEAEVAIGTLTQEHGQIKGDLEISGDADLTDATWQGGADAEHVVTVNGTTTVHGSLTLRDAVLDGNDVTLAPGATESAHVAMQQTYAAFTARGKLRQTDAWAVISQEKGTNGEFEAKDLVVGAGQQLRVDAEWTLGPDQRATVASGGSLWLKGEFTDKGTLTNNGDVLLDGDTTIHQDVDSAARSELLVGSVDDVKPTVTLVGDPIIGGEGATITNNSFITGAGELVGTVTNNGRIAPSPLITIDGNYVQDALATLDVTLADGVPTGLRMSGTAKLDGTLKAQSTTDLHEVRRTVLSAASIQGAMTPDLEEDCDDVEATSTKIDITTGACFEVYDSEVTEGESTASVGVDLSRPMPDAVTLSYKTLVDSAGTDDFTMTHGTVQVPAGQTEATIEVPITDDQQQEQDETFVVAVSSSDIPSAGGESTVTIEDDDATLAYAVQGISKLGNDQQVYGVGRKYAAGQFENGGRRGWIYSVADEGIFETDDGLQPTAVSSRDVVAGICGGVLHSHACVRDHGVTTDLVDGDSTDIAGINAAGVMVGRHYLKPFNAVLYSAPGAAPTVLDPITGAEYSKALDINSLGTVLGMSRAAGKDVIWTRTAAGAVTRAFELPGDRDHFVLSGKISRAGELLVVAETFGSNSSLTTTNSLHWTAKGGLVTDDGQRLFISDMNDSGDQIGNLHGRAKLWKGGKVYDLTGSTPQDALDGATLRWPRAIGDEGTMVVDGTYGDDTTGHMFALVPAGAGCYVCAEVDFHEAKFPSKNTMIAAGDEVVEGNPAEVAVELHNTDSVTQTVKVSLTDDDGKPLGATRTIGLAAGERKTIISSWTTEGRAWKNGADAGLSKVTATVTDDTGETVDEASARIRVVPRPVVLVHREFSNAANWSAYPAKLQNAHVGWKAVTVDTMDTGALGYTISHNAKHLAPFVTKTQTEQNAWQVDLLAEGIGGLVSRSYVHRYLKDSDSVTPVRRLLMMSTMNEGTRCATLFTLPGLGEMSPRMVEKFNERTFERRGVEFSALAGTASLATCGWPAVGDGFVSEESSLSGVDDTMSMPIRRGQFRSTAVFERYVLPRLNGGSAPAPAPLAAGSGLLAVAAPVVAATVVAGAQSEPDATQLINGAETMTVGPGQTVRATEAVPSGLDAVTATAFAPGAAASITLRLDKSGAEQAVGTTTDEADFVTASAQHPAAGTWGLSVTNHGAETLKVPVALAAIGGATTLHADAQQVGVSHRVRITAHLEGAALPQAPRPMLVKVASGGGENQGQVLTDKGTNGDTTAGDGIYTGVLDTVPDGLITLDVATDESDFYRRTTVSALVETIEDGPGDDAPIAFDQQVEMPGDERATFKVEAADPEGASLGYEVVTKPAHGKVGGTDAFFDYLPNAGFRGTDSFTFRAYDGAQWSTPATVRITVQRARADLQLAYPTERKLARGAPFTARADVRSLSGAPVGDGKVTFTWGDHSVTTDVDQFVAQVQLPTDDLSIGTHDLGVSYAGNAAYAPQTLHVTITLEANRAPAPTTDPVVGEAGYRTRLEVFDHDPDGNAVKLQVDWEDDGTYDETHLVPAQPDGTVPGLFLHTYPSARDGHARVLVTDADGGTGEVTTSVHVTPHRAQGPLDRVRVGDKPVRLVAVSSNGRRVLYEDRNQYAPNHPTSAFGVLDRESGSHAWASVRPDGTLEDNPLEGVLSPDGRWVAWVGTTAADNTAFAMFVRDLTSGTTRKMSSPQASLVAVRENVLYVVQQGLLRVIDLTSGTSTVLSRRTDGTDIRVEESTTRTAALSSNGRHLVFGVRGGQLWLVEIDGAGTASPAVRLSVPASEASDAAASQISVSDSGNDIVFTSEAADLVPEDTNDEPDVYHLDRSTSTTSLVSVTPAGRAGNTRSEFSSASTDGHRVLLWSEASDLVAGDTNKNADVFVRELGSRVTRRLSIEPRDELQGNQESLVALALSGDGRFAWFESTAQNLVPDRDWTDRDLFVRDLGEAAPVCHLQAPTDVTRTTAEDTAVDVPLGEGCPGSTWSVVDAPQHGTLSGSGATRSYAATPDWNGTDTFTYRVSSGAESVTGIARVTVSAVNDAPVGKDVTGVGSEDEALVLSLTGADVDGDTLGYEVVTPPAHGSLAGTGAMRTFTPMADWNGADSFTYRVTDGTTSSPVATARITLAPVNDAPVAKDLAGEVKTGQPLALTFSGTDVDGDTLTYEVASQPGHGTLTGSGAQRSYTPAAGWSGMDTFTYRASDGKLSATATVRIAVAATTATNHAPVAKALEVCALEDQVVKVTLAGTDVDKDPLTYDVVTAPTHGVVNGTGTARTYTPFANWNGTDTFTYRVSDGKLSATATVRVNVRGVNDAPIAKDVTEQGREDQAVNVTLPGTDPDGDKLTWKVVTAPTHGTLTGTTASRTFTPRANWNGTEQITVQVSDGTLSVTARLQIVVSPVNDAPKVTLTGPTSLTTKDAGLFTATTTDADGDKAVCKISWGDGSATTGCAAKHTWSKAGTFTVTVTATDAAGATGTATRKVTVCLKRTSLVGRTAV